MLQYVFYPHIHESFHINFGAKIKKKVNNYPPVDKIEKNTPARYFANGLF
jgi:hypothetical protein